MRGTTPVYRPMFAVDIEESAGRGDAALLQGRAVLADAVRSAVEESGIELSQCSWTTHGDLVRVITPAGSDKALLLYPMLHNLSTRLRVHNRTAGPAGTVRVRAAVHAGTVHVDEGEVVGGALELLTRLLDAPPLKAALAGAPPPVTVAVLVSEHVYDDAVRHGHRGIDPATFGPRRFTVKETTATGWLQLPGWGLPPDEPAVAVAVPPPAGGNDATTVRATNVAMGSATVGQMIGHLGSQSGNVAGIRAADPDRPGSGTLHDQLIDLEAMLRDFRRAGALDEETYAAAEIELREAERHAAAGGEKGQGRLLIALRKLRAVVEDVAELGTKITSLIAAVRGL
jgi:hypothetical protein